MEEKSYFASPERSDDDMVKADKALITSQKYFTEIFGAINGIGAIINRNRQIVYANEEFLSVLGIESLDPVLGKRPGEAISCVHAGERPSGCGTSEACRVCGAVSAVVESQRINKKVVHETRITSMINGQMKSWDLKVASAPIIFSGQPYFVLTIEDISSEKKKENLEQIFFHDILNIAGGLNGLLDALKETDNTGEVKNLIDMSVEASRNLIEEIAIHKQLHDAEREELMVIYTDLNTTWFLESAVNKVKFLKEADGKVIKIAEDTVDETIKCDRILLQRVMINLLRNALEATESGGEVRTGCYTSRENFRLWVWNSAVIPDKVRLQIFQRSFSTKGRGRGIGTYSVRLLTEKFLNGKAWFTSTREEGTFFNVELPRLPGQ